MTLVSPVCALVSLAKRTFVSTAAKVGSEPKAAGLKSRPSLMQQIDRSGRSESHAAMQPRKRHSRLPQGGTRGDDRIAERPQRVNATHALKRSAGVA